MKPPLPSKTLPTNQAAKSAAEIAQIIFGPPHKAAATAAPPQPVVPAFAPSLERGPGRALRQLDGAHADARRLAADEEDRLAR